MKFRYWRGPAGWGFADGGRATELEGELTSGSLRVAAFARHLSVVGHLRAGAWFFVVYKPRGKREIVGCRLSEGEYAAVGFDPFRVAAETFGVEMREATDVPEGPGPWPAETDSYLGQAARFFRQLSMQERVTGYLSALPDGVTRRTFPNTRFRQVMVAAGEDGGARGNRLAAGEESALKNLDGRVREQGDTLRAHRIALAAIERTLMALQKGSRTGKGGGGGERGEREESTGSRGMARGGDRDAGGRGRRSAVPPRRGSWRGGSGGVVVGVGMLLAAVLAVTWWVNREVGGSVQVARTAEVAAAEALDRAATAAAAAAAAADRAGAAEEETASASARAVMAERAAAAASARAASAEVASAEALARAASAEAATAAAMEQAASAMVDVEAAEAMATSWAEAAEAARAWGAAMAGLTAARDGVATAEAVWEAARMEREGAVSRALAATNDAERARAVERVAVASAAEREAADARSRAVALEAERAAAEEEAAAAARNAMAAAERMAALSAARTGATEAEEPRRR